MAQKKLMILGASQLQLPAIIKAKEMGLHVIVLDINKDAVGTVYADEFYEISTIDIEHIVIKAKELKIDGIMTLATDMPMRAVAAVGEMLGLNTINYETAIMATNKVKMREILSYYGVPIPFFSSVRTYEDFKRVVNTFHGDLIVKPADSSGSRGVFLLQDNIELEKIYNYSKKYSRSGEIIIEEYMKGLEVSVETITINGNTHVIAITDKVTTGPPYFVEMGHSIQSLLPEDIKKNIEEVAKAAISALGIDNSPAHTEIIITNQGAKIVELGARLGGDNITTSLVPLATGVDMVRACIDLAIGNKPDVRQKFSKGSAIRYFNSHEGVLSKIDGIDEVKNKAGIFEVTLLKSLGDKVNNIRNSTDRIGYVIAHAESPQMAIHICQQAMDEIKIVIQ